MSVSTMIPELEKAEDSSTKASLSTLNNRFYNSSGIQFSPPADRGKRAWGFLAALFVLETIIWGYGTSFGILMEHYHNDPGSPIGRESSSKTILPLAGTINTGIIALAAPLLSFLMESRPTVKRPLMLSGLSICGISLLVSSYARTCLQVLWTQGVGYGIGGAALYFPALSYLPEWFVARQGLANGIIFAGTGLGGLIFPFIMNGLISKVGMPVTLRIMAGAITFLVGVAIFFIGPRVSTSSRSNSTPALNRSGGKGSLGNSYHSFKCSVKCVPWPFMVYLLSNTLQSVAYFLPGLYLPSYSHFLGFKGSSGTGLVAVMNAGCIISRVLAGTLSDHYSPHLIGSVSSFLGGMITIVMWGVFGSTGYPTLLAFSLLFGSTAGAWTCLFFGVVRCHLAYQTHTMSFFGLISLTRGLGNVIGGPASSALNSPTSFQNSKMQPHFPAGPYSKLICFTGSLLISTGLIELFLYFRQSFFNPASEDFESQEKQLSELQS